MAKRTIAHAVFQYQHPDGHFELAFRGETVDLPDEAIKRGEEHGAFTDRVGDEPDNAGNLPTLSTEATDQEVLAYVKAAKVTEISDYLGQQPSMAQRIMAAEKEASKGKPRSGVVESVTHALKAAPGDQTSGRETDVTYDEKNVADAIAFLDALPEEERDAYFALERSRGRKGVLDHFDQPTE